MNRAPAALAAIVMLGCVALAPPSAKARALPAASIPAPSALCRAAILAAEHGSRVPDRLLDAIAVVESGKRDPVSGAVYPWPWTINAEGVGHWYDTKDAAVAAARDMQAHGIRSIDVGCMQVNLMHHPDAFASLEQAFDPVTNAAYAAVFLTKLYSQTNAWPLAAGAYHSFTPDLGAEYTRKVLAAWGIPQLSIASQTVTVATMAPPAPLPNVVTGGGGGSRVAVLLPPVGSEAIRVMPLPAAGASAGSVTPGGGRSLDAYRSTPISGAAKFPRSG